MKSIYGAAYTSPKSTFRRIIQRLLTEAKDLQKGALQEILPERLRTPVILGAAALIFLAGDLGIRLFCADPAFARPSPWHKGEAFPTPGASMCSLLPRTALLLELSMALAILLALRFGRGGQPETLLQRSMVRASTFVAVLLSLTVAAALLVALYFFSALDPNTFL